jgi:hypothetical protein
VHKGSTQTNKRSKLGFKKRSKRNRRVPWSGAPDCPVCHRIVSGAPGPYKSKLATFGFLQRHSTIIHRTVRCAKRSNDSRRNGRLHSTPDSTTVRCRSQSRGQRRTGQWTVPVWCGTGLSGATRSQRSNGWLRQNPNGWVTWLVHRTGSGGAPDWPVRPSTAACPNGLLVVEGYKYPPTTTTPSIQAFTTPHSIQEQSATLQDTNQSHRSDQCPKFNSSSLGLVKITCVSCCSCLLGLAFFSFLLLTLKCFVSEARDTNCVVILVGSKWPVRLRKKPH